MPLKCQRSPEKMRLGLLVQPEVVRLLKTIAGIKDTSVNALVNMAIERFLEDET
jgi:hypothetical protein